MKAEAIIRIEPNPIHRRLTSRRWIGNCLSEPIDGDRRVTVECDNPQLADALLTAAVKVIPQR